MIARSVLFRTVAPVVMAAFIACGDGATEPEMDMLTLQESEALLEAVQRIGLTELEDDVPVPHVDITRACSGGGEATAVGTVLPSGTEEMATVAVDLTLVPRDCMETARGLSFMLNGAPSLREMGTISISVADEFTFVLDLDLSFFGTLAYGLDGRIGTCDISVRVVSRVDLAALAQTGTATGTLCGNPVDMDLSGPVTPQG